MLKFFALSSELSRPLPLAHSSDESLVTFLIHDSVDRLCGLAQVPSTKYNIIQVVDRPPKCHNPSFRGRTAKNQKPSRRRPRRVVLGQAGTGSRGVASCIQRRLCEKQVFRRSPIIAHSPCIFHGQLSGGGGCVVYMGGLRICGQTPGPNIAFPARFRAGGQTTALSVVNR
jgi:hypothetical protein